MGSSLPNHDAKDLERIDKKKSKKENKENPRVDCIRQGWSKKTEKNNLNDAWIVQTHDASSNALRRVQWHFRNQQLTWT